MSDNYCRVVLSRKGYTISTWEQLPWREHREFEIKIIGRVNNFNSQYPAWIAEGTSTYYNKNKLTGAITSYSSATGTYEASSYGSSDYRYNGEYIGTNGVVISGKESAIYGYVSNKMNSSYPNMWVGQWSHTIEGNVNFTVADGICYRPDGTTAPPNGLPPPPARIYLGNAAPPPPPPPDMNCCDCNTISTILAEQIIAEAKQHEATRELIDRRTIEALREINKMLQGMQIDLNLQPIIDRLNELEANLWNGLKAGS